MGEGVKGIVLAGGAGSRLYPLTELVGKSLLPVYDKPMIYYPLTTLIESGIREICIISTPHDLPRLKQLLGGGERFGVEFTYLEQRQPRGIAQAFTIAAEFIKYDPVTLILGDNIFHGSHQVFQTSVPFGVIFACHVKDPSRYGVVEMDEFGNAVSIEEKPANPKSSYAIPGMYTFDNEVVEVAHAQKPSARGELEITDIIRAYLEMGRLSVVKLGRSFAWLDAGTSSSLQDASAYVRTIEQRTGVKIGCPEEAAWRSGFITKDHVSETADKLPDCEYRDYLMNL